jgi:TonB-linked SusC/RagA family outer membrane protein
MTTKLSLLIYFKRSSILKKKISVMLFFSILYSFAVAQPKLTMSGKVTHDNIPLSGASVKVKGSVRGTTSNTAGNFSIAVNKGETLVFSFVGYDELEVAVKNETNLHIEMTATVSALSEVVLVGFGTKKKANLTGAVGTVTSKELEKRTVTKSSLALQGQMSGISVRQGSGNPGDNQAGVLVRGQGTFSGAGTSPLVLVDGIESSLDNVDPADIANISVLKDAASASIFGSKAANGVILVETKSGVAGKMVVNYSSYVGKNKPTFLPKMINSWEYAQVINTINPGTYSDADIQKYKSGTDPNYLNFDHIKYLFDSGNGIETKQNISASGGSAATRYLFSFGYYNDQAIIEKNSSNRYVFRLNVDSKISEKLRFSVKLAGNADNSKEPSFGYGPGVSGIILGAMRNANNIPGPTPDGFYGRNETLHPEADLNSKSFLKNQNLNFYGNAQLIWDIAKGLKITGQTGYTWGGTRSLYFGANYPVTPTYSIAVNQLTDSWSQPSSLTFRAFADYNKTLKGHTFHLLGGAERLSNDFKNITAFRDGFPNNEIYVLSAGATVHATNGGSASKNTLASYFGRLNYDFREKYLFEANVRYDGSSRFPANSRWGTFPSFSAGWRISKEPFFQNAFSWINELKIRGSWGKLGNQSIGNYPYQNLLSLGQNYPFGSQMSAGAAITTIPNTNITWESTAITDMGIDMSLLNSKLNLSVDYYDKVTSDILYNVSVSGILGATPSSTNAGKVGNKGWDFNASYQSSAGKFTYGASAIFSIVHNKVLGLANVSKDISRGLFIGYPIGSAYGYVSDGLFASNQAVAAYATQPFSTLATGGGIKLLDLSGPNGKPDGVVNSTYDRKVIGTPLPITTYALTLNAGYKNFDLYVMLQGEGGRKAPVTLAQFFYPLENNSNVQRTMYENSWTVQNPDPNAEYPKIIPTSSGFYNNNPISFWYRNATFLRLKSVQLGYNLPEGILNKTFLSRVRIYVSGENLATLTNYFKGWDPEMTTSGSKNFYPLLRVFAAGINIRF